MMEKTAQKSIGARLMFTRLGLANLEAMVDHFKKLSTEDLVFRFQQPFDGPDRERQLRSFLAHLLSLAKGSWKNGGWFGAQDESGELVVVAACALHEDESVLSASLSIVPRLRGSGARDAAFSWLIQLARDAQMKEIQGYFLPTNIAMRKSLERHGISYEIGADGKLGCFRFKVLSEQAYVQQVLNNLQLLFASNEDMLARLPPADAADPAPATAANTATTPTPRAGEPQTKAKL